MTFYKYRLVNGTSMQTHCMYAQYAYCYDVYIFIIEQSSGMHYQLTLYCFHNMQLSLAEQRVPCNYMFAATMEPTPRKLAYIHSYFMFAV